MSWSRDDLTAGLIFLGIGMFFAGNTLLSMEVGTAAAMGPGFFPLALCLILILLGVAILLNARRQASEAPRPFNRRAVVLVLAAPVAFSTTLRDLGLVPALVIALTLAVAARPAIGLVRGAAIVAGMTVFCVGVFHYGLGVPVELLNPSLLN